MASDDPLAPIPLLILTGYLGAGKTTHLNRWLAAPDAVDTLVIINEYGEIGLDHLLIEDAPGDVVLLAAGCLCCTVRGDLVATLEDLLRRRDNRRIRFFRRVILETTGLADPLPILHAILQHPYLSKRFAITSVTTLVDVVNAADTLARYEEARRQVALADRLLLTKTDLASPEALAAVRRHLESLNPFASSHLLNAIDLPAAQLFATLFTPENGATAQWLGEFTTPDHLEASNIFAFPLAADAAISPEALIVFQEALRLMHGPRILRLKGLLRLADDPERPAAIHQVQSVTSPARRLDGWPSRDRRSRLVVITQGLPREAIEPFWNALLKQGSA